LTDRQRLPRLARGASLRRIIFKVPLTTGRNMT
jgi:hypothetical protein